MQMKNKKLSTIIIRFKSIAKRLFIRLVADPAVVVCDRPIHRDIRLNSSAAIRIWLATTDRPLCWRDPVAVWSKDIPIVYTTPLSDGLTTFIQVDGPCPHGDKQSTGGGTSLDEKE